MFGVIGTLLLSIAYAILLINPLAMIKENVCIETKGALLWPSRYLFNVFLIAEIVDVSQFVFIQSVAETAIGCVH